MSLRDYLKAEAEVMEDREWFHPALRICVLVALWLFSVWLLATIMGCATPVNPVKYQAVEVLVTKPCFAGRNAPTPAGQLTEPVCVGSDAECVRAAKADILELQREAREYRNLFRECSK